MPNPHFDISITQRSQGKSAVAGAAYQSGEKLFSEYDQKMKDYTRKRGIVYTEIMLPANAPPEYADRQVLWNSAEEVEKQWNSQLARRFVLTFPREVHVKDKKVLQQPVKELEALRRGEERAVSVLEKKGTKVFEAEVQNITGNHFRAVLAKELVLEYVNGRFEMKFTSQDKTSVSAGRSLRFREVSEVRNVRILADVSSVEVFVNDGETVFSTRYYPQDYEIKIEALDAKIAFWEL